MEKKRVNVYFNEDEDITLFAEIEAFAKKEKRSLNQQIKVMLTESANIRRERLQGNKEAS
jgi:hypothetical protein